MTVSVVFDGGPIHGMTGRALNLPTLQIFFDKRQRQVFVYRKTNEVNYVFSAEMSRGLTVMYDDAFKKFGSGDNSIEGWTEKTHEK